jgi:formate dehydrogenase (NADP+) alpha subunit
MTKILLNGKHLDVPSGSTILDATKQTGDYVPTLCYHPQMSPLGNCRMCMVEVKGWPRMAPACYTKVNEGMEITTNSDTVKEAQRYNADLHLQNHDLTCWACEQDGLCELQDVIYKLGIKEPRFGTLKKLKPIHKDNPFIQIDNNKCILCARCIEACDNVQVQGVLAIKGEGVNAMLLPKNTTFDDSGCVYCGHCVSACPVEALQEVDAVGKGRDAEFTHVPVVCVYCGVGCQFDLAVKDNRVVKIQTREEYKPNGISTCVKGKFGYGFLSDSRRLTKPLIKENGAFREASWEEALTLVASKLGKIRDTLGGRAIGTLSSSKCTNEENYVFQKWVRACLKTNSVDTCTRLCHSSSVAALRTALGDASATGDIEGISNGDLILITGSDTTVSHPVIGTRIKQAGKKGTTLIVVDPRRVEIAESADIYLQPKPSTDIAWLNGFLHVVIREGLVSKEFIDKRTEGYEAVKESVKDYTPQKVEEITGIPAKDLERAAIAYGKAKNATIFWSMGLSQSSHGVDNVHAVINLALACGQFGRSGSGLHPLRGQNNVQGSSDFGALPMAYPGYQDVNVEEHWKKFEKAWGVPLDHQLGLKSTQMVEEMHAGNLKGMFIMGENPIISDPDRHHTEAAFKKLEFMVVQDIFMTETAELADVVLPAAAWGEKEGTFVNTERRVAITQAGLIAPGEARLDWKIICEISTRMGYPMAYKGPAEIFDEATPLMPALAGLRYDRLAPNGILWPCPTLDHPGTRDLYTESFPVGRGKFQPVQHRLGIEVPDADYPLVYTTGRSLFHWHTGTVTRKTDLELPASEPVAEVNALDAEPKGIADGDWIWVETRRGKIRCRAALTEKVPEGVVFVPMHYAEASANTLTVTYSDPVSGIPDFKFCAARISLAEKGEAGRKVWGWERMVHTKAKE